VTTRSGSQAVSTRPVRTSGASPPADAAQRRPFGPFGWIPVTLRFPILIALAVVVLGGLGLSGSSVSIDATIGSHSASGSVGRARPIRTDEYQVRTPLAVRQAVLGFPDHNEIGVGEHDMGVLYDLPTRGWEIVVRPQTLPYHVLGVERSFAFEWWILFLALPGLGVYALALALGVRTLTAALIAMLVVLSPFVQWWTLPVTGTAIGYTCLAAAALVAATRVRSVPAKVGMGAVAGWLGACAVVVVYPPSVVPLALVAGAAAVAAIARSFPPRAQRPRWWMGLLVALAAACAVGGVLVIAFVVTHRGALNALSSSVYPGMRRNGGGTQDPATLFGTPFDLVQSTRSAAEVAVNGLNQSEASAGLFTIFAVAAAVVANRTRAFWKPWQNHVVLLTVVGASMLLLAWYFFPIPEAVGRVLLLDRVPPFRLLVTFLIASALALGLFFDEQRRAEAKLPPFALAAGTLAFAVPTAWAGLRLQIDGETPPLWQVLLLAVGSTIGVALALRGLRAGLWLLVVLLAAGAVAVNPIQHGLSPLLDSPSARLGRELRNRPGTGKVLDFWTGPRGETARVGLTASGVDLVSGVNLYPNKAAWRVLDPNDSARRVWNRYNNAVWNPAPTGMEPSFHLYDPYTIRVDIDPCDPRLQRLGVRTVVTIVPFTAPCLRETDRIPAEDGGPVFAYRIDRSRV
jgi:hypothetical protein